MRKVFIAIVILITVTFGLAVGVRLLADREAAPAISSPQPGSGAARATPADRQVRKAEAVIKATPSRPEGYNLLAAAYLQKARETGDAGLNVKAEAAIRQAFALAPDSMDAKNLQATLLVANHQFAAALDVARRAQQARPDNPDVYGPLTDALVELGDYGGAITAAQKMMDLRPDGASYARAAYLRALHGDAAGAVEALRVAAQSASARDLEGIAWYRVNLGNALMNTGKLAEAEREYDAALDTFADYHLALAAKARARAIAGDYGAAVEFYERALQRVPLADTAIALGDLYAVMGRAADAQRQHEFAEFIEQAGAPGGDPPSRLLALLWADRDTRLDQALAIMRRERAARADIYTCDALAWCLFKKGEVMEAKAAIAEALRLGTRDALIYYHAGAIYNALGDRAGARRYMKLALDARVSFNNSYAAFSVLQAEAAKRMVGAT